MNFIISYPRSGQHLVSTILEYMTTAHDMEYSYCEFYSCCRTFPCKKDALFLKNHDLDGKVPITPENKYLVLYRKDPLLQLEAYARYKNKTSMEQVVNFIHHHKKSYDRFVMKWCSTTTTSNILVVDYYELLASPIESTRAIFRHFFPSIELQSEVWDTMLSRTFLVDNGRRLHVPRCIEPPRTIDPVYYQQLLENTTIKKKSNRSYSDSNRD